MAARSVVVRRCALVVVLVSIAACSSSSHPSSGSGSATASASGSASGSGTASASASETGTVSADRCDGVARELAAGLTHERWPIDVAPAIPVEACIDLVRADLTTLRPRIVTASRDGEPRPAPAWLAELHLVAAINAGMFLDDRHAVGLLVDGAHVDQRRDNPKLGGFLAFDPRDPKAPAAVIAGRGCPGFDLAALRARYRSIVQSYRLLGCDGAAIPWADEKAYSSAAIAIDRAGRLVFIHVRAPFRMRELARTLADPRLALTGAIFVEGGPEATVAVAGPHPLLLVGSYETGFVETDANHDAWALPNLVALAPR